MVSGHISVRRCLLKNIVLFLGLLFLSLPILSACGQMGDFEPSTDSAAKDDSAEGEGNADEEKPKVGAKLVMPPGMDSRPLKPGQSETATLPNGLPALQPLKGVKVDELFTKKITDTDQRFDRLENAVLDMRREFEAVKPAIVRLVAVEEDIGKLVEQLDVMVKGEPVPSAPVTPVMSSELDQIPAPAMASPPAATPQTQTGTDPVQTAEASAVPAQATPPPVQPAAIEDTMGEGPVSLTPPPATAPATLPPVAAKPFPAPVPAAVPAAIPGLPVLAAATPAPAAPIAPAVPPAQAPAPSTSVASTAPPSSAKTAVREIRFGVHEGYTRIVLDLGAQTPHSVDIDNQEKLVVISLPEAGWNAPASGTQNGPLVKSYAAQAVPGGGTNLALVTARGVKVKSSGILPPGANPNTRLFIDLAPE